MSATEDIILTMIERMKILPAHVTEASNLYTDLGFDSLSYTVLLMRIEKACDVTIPIAEIQNCVEVSKLIAYVEEKQREKGAAQ